MKNTIQSPEPRVVTIGYKARQSAISDLSLIQNQRWVALENEDGSYTWIDQVAAKTQRIDAKALKVLCEALSTRGNDYASIH